MLGIVKAYLMSCGPALDGAAAVDRVGWSEWGNKTDKLIHVDRVTIYLEGIVVITRITRKRVINY